MRRVRVAYISPGEPFYGAERCLFGLLSNLDREKFSPVVVIPNGANYKTDLFSLNIEIIEINSSFRFAVNNLIKMIKVNLSLIRLILKKDIGLVHFNMYSHGESLFLFLIFLKMNRIPYIFHLQTPNIFGLFDRFIMFRGHIICVSRAIRQQLILKRRSDFLTKPIKSKIHLIYYGRDLSDYSKVHPKSSLKKEFHLKEEKVIGFIGAINERKRVDLFLRVANETKKIYSNVKFLIVGDTYSNSESDLIYKANILRMVEDLGLREDIIFTGFRNDINRILKVVNIFVLTSKRDPLPGVLIEAMACGIPIVGSAVDGVLDLVEDGKTGFLIYSDNAKDYAEKIVCLLNNEELEKRMGLEGKKRAADFFNIRQNSLEIMNLYDNILNNN